MSANDAVELSGELVATPSPSPDVEDVVRIRPLRGPFVRWFELEVLVDDGVAPDVELLEAAPETAVPLAGRIDLRQEAETQAVEIRPQRTGVRVSGVELAVVSKEPQGRAAETLGSTASDRRCAASE